MEDNIFKKITKWLKCYIFVKNAVPETMLIFIISPIIFLYIFFDKALYQSIYIYFSGSVCLLLLYQYMIRKYRSFFEIGIAKKQYMYQMIAGSLFFLVISLFKLYFSI